MHIKDNVMAGATTIQFATCERRSALEFIQKVYPSREITDTPECAGPLLDFVEQDIVRIQDPMMHGNRIEVRPGTKWKEDASLRQRILAACRIFTNEDGTGPPEPSPQQPQGGR